MEMGRVKSRHDGVLEHPTLQTVLGQTTAQGCPAGLWGVLPPCRPSLAGRASTKLMGGGGFGSPEVSECAVPSSDSPDRPGTWFQAENCSARCFFLPH